MTFTCESKSNRIPFPENTTDSRGCTLTEKRMFNAPVPLQHSDRSQLARSEHKKGDRAVLKEQTMGSSSSNTGGPLPNRTFGSASCKHWPKSSARGWMGMAGLSAEGLMQGFQADDVLRLVVEGLFVPSCMQCAGCLGWQDGDAGSSFPVLQK